MHDRARRGYPLDDRPPRATCRSPSGHEKVTTNPPRGLDVTLCGRSGSTPLGRAAPRRPPAGPGGATAPGRPGVSRRGSEHSSELFFVHTRWTPSPHVKARPWAHPGPARPQASPHLVHSRRPCPQASTATPTGVSTRVVESSPPGFYRRPRTASRTGRGNTLRTSGRLPMVVSYIRSIPSGETVPAPGGPPGGGGGRGVPRRSPTGR